MPYHGVPKGSVKSKTSVEVWEAYSTRREGETDIVTVQRSRYGICVENSCGRLVGKITETRNFVMVRCLGGPTEECRPHCVNYNPFGYRTGRKE